MLTTGYSLTATTGLSFAEAVERVRAELQAEGCGVLCEIDVQATLKAKLGVDGEPYLILGACNPQLASRGLKTEPDLGVLLPCNVVVRTVGQSTHIAAMEPFAALQLADNPDLEPLAAEARERIQKAVNAA